MTERLRLDRQDVSLGVVAVVVLVGVYLRSGPLRWFDAALARYLFATLPVIFATVYRCMVNRAAGIDYPVWAPRQT